MEIRISRDADTPIYQQIEKQLKDLILRGELMDGFILPSERKMADLIGVHRNTITKVYNTLKSQGYIKSTERSGYIVSFNEGTRFEKDVRNTGFFWKNRIKDEYNDSKAIDYYDRKFRKFSGKRYSFVGTVGCDDKHSYNIVDMVLKQIVKMNSSSKYSISLNSQGEEQLRMHLVDFLQRKGINARKSEIQICSESYQAITYLINLLLNPGDSVLLCEPVDPDIQIIFKKNRIKLHTVDMDKDGISIEKTRKIVSKECPKAIYVEPDSHNPTGIKMSLERRKELLGLAYEFKIPIIEEGMSSDIIFCDPIPPLKALDTKNYVIYVHSFWYTLPSAIRVAFICGDSNIIHTLTRYIGSQIYEISGISQEILKQYFINNIYIQETKRISSLYEKKISIACESLNKYRNEIIDYDKPKGGVNLWIKIIPKIDKEELGKISMEEQVGFLDGSIFFPEGSMGENYIRLNFSQIEEADICIGIEKMMKAIVKAIVNS